MSVRINIPLFLQRLVPNDVRISEVNGNTVGECLRHLVEQFPIIEKELFDKNGKLAPNIDIYVNKESTYPEELSTPVKDRDELDIIIILGGG
jgi:molybdopterin converting factor small subunit